jgi:DNA-binding CsgD family transcriptional regulator
VTAQVADKVVIELIDRVYAAARDAQHWQEVIDGCQSLFPGTGLALLADGKGVGPCAFFTGYDPAYIESYNAHYHTMNPYTAAFRHVPVGQVTTQSAQFSNAWLKRQPFYHEWLKPAGGFAYGACVTMMNTDALRLRMSFDIPERHKSLETPTARLLTRLGPHVLRATEFSTLFHGSLASDLAIKALLGRLAWPAMVVDARGTIRAANDGAEALLRAGKIVRVQQPGRLHFVSHTIQAQFAEAMRATTRREGLPPPRRISLNGEGASRVLHVVRLCSMHGMAGVVGDDLLALVMIAPTTPARDVVAIEHLRAMFGLTKAEAAVVQKLAAGLNVAETAAALRVTRTTVRNQLAAAKAKAGVRRQAELVAVLTSLTPRFDLGDA